MTESPAVFRNARYEARLAFHEQRIAALEGRVTDLAAAFAGLFQVVQGLQGSVHALGAWMQAQAETLPGEQTRREAARPN
jgi:hypothetical protein